MRTGHFLSLCAITIFLALVSVRPSDPVQPEDGCSKMATAIRGDIERVGAEKVLQELFSDYTAWVAFRGCIAQGQTDWLLLARTIHDVADAGPSSQIPLSVGEALGYRPETVLNHVADRMDEEHFHFIDICQGPDIDDPRFDGLELALNEINNRINSLRSVSIVELERKRDRCIALLEESKAHVRRFYGDEPQLESHLYTFLPSGVLK